MKKYSIIFLLIYSCLFLSSHAESPQLAVIFVVDQFAYSQLRKIRPHLKYGLKKLCDNSVEFVHAHYAHAMPATGPGHTTLNTGVQPKDHGIVGNYWHDEKNEKYPCDMDCASNAASFESDGSSKRGKSAINMMVDGVSDQVMLDPIPCNNQVFGISLKARAAICMAGHCGKAIWYDNHAHTFTSSKAYFKELPSWLSNFNATMINRRPKEILWRPALDLHSSAYAFKNSTNYEWSASKKPLVNSLISTKHRDFLKAPQSQQLVLNLALNCFRSNYKPGEKNRFLLWISLSNLDKVGHEFGPDVIEAIDLLYHLDRQLLPFMNMIEKVVPPSSVMYALTGDHGVAPIPELVEKEGFPSRRILIPDIIKDLNTFLDKELKIKNLVLNYKSPQFFLDQSLWRPLSDEKQDKIVHVIKKYLYKQKGIKNVWSKKELKKMPLDKDSVESFFKNQLYPGRSGDITIQTQPFVQFTNYKTGSGHETPYGHDTHVPLFMYQKGKFEKTKIYTKVWMQQFANTLADILQVARPSASFYHPLPIPTMKNSS